MPIVKKSGGAIPKYDIKTNPDIVDKVIEDLKAYTKSLIYEDTALARQIEEYLKKREISDQQKQDRREAKSKGYDDVQLEDKDYQEYYEHIEEEKSLDKHMNEGDDVEE